MITADTIKNSPNDWVFVFGDNMEHRGLGGQAAVARPFVDSGKAVGLPTKIGPRKGAFFSGLAAEWFSVKVVFARLWELALEGKYIVFFPGIGEGYANLAEECPAMLYYIKKEISRLCDAKKATVWRD